MADDVDLSDGHARRSAASPARNGRRAQKVSETVALEIIRDITNRGLTEGDRLPREVDMLGHYGVSRSSLREALRLLEVQGLIRIRPGPGGGPVVAVADPRNLSKTLRLHLHLMGVTYDELLAAWQTFDPLLASMAARNPDRQTVRAAMEPHLDLGGEEDVRSAGEAFHTAVARLAGNPALAFLYQALTATMENHVVEAVRRANFDDEIVAEHHDVAQAIIDGDAETAHRLMDEHVADMVSHFREYLPLVIGDRVRLS